jgi:RNA polymerase sigma factor (sigma-70 family)
VNPASGPRVEVERLLASSHHELLTFVRRRAGAPLLRLETADDLVQGVCAHVLERGLETISSDDAGRRAWLLRVADNFVKDRRDYWAALKRSGSLVLRLSLADTVAPDMHSVRDLAASVTGPSTFAVRREQVSVAAIALDMLLPRDRELIETMCQGLSIDDQAQQLGLTYDATERARARAVERFQRTFRLALQGRG